MVIVIPMREFAAFVGVGAGYTLVEASKGDPSLRFNEGRAKIQEGNPNFLEAYFAEILAGSLLFLAFMVFLIYIYWTRDTAPITIPTDENGYPYRYVGKYGRVSVSGQGKVEPDFPQQYNLNLKRKSVDIKKCSKPSCLCENPEKKGKRKWNYKEDLEPYGPANV